jgi:hypothetical protein
MVDYTPYIIIIPNVKSIGPRRSCVHKIMKMLENIKASELVESKWRDYMTTYTSWPIILPNMKAIRQMISEE